MVATTVREITRVTSEGLVFSAPQLLPLVRLMLQVREAPADKSSYIQLRLLSQQGLDRCPSCRCPLGLDGYRRTKTAFSDREVLACVACRTSFLLTETSRA